MPRQRGPFHETHAQPGERKYPAEFRTGTLRSEGARSDRRLNAASQGPVLALRPPVAGTLHTAPSDVYGPPIANRWPVFCHAEVLSISAPVLDRFGSEIVASDALPVSGERWTSSPWAPHHRATRSWRSSSPSLATAPSTSWCGGCPRHHIQARARGVVMSPRGNTDGSEDRSLVAHPHRTNDRLGPTAAMGGSPHL